MALGITPLSWAQWLAKALDLPYTSYAFNGATTADVLASSCRACASTTTSRRSTRASTTSASRPSTPPPTSATSTPSRRRWPRAPRALLLLTLPEDLGRPTSAPKPVAANAAVRRVAERHGAIVADLADFGGWTLVQPDVVHPTPLGQVEMADRAARALGCTMLPSDLVRDRRGHDVRYVPAHARAVARNLARRARERVIPPR